MTDEELQALVNKLVGDAVAKALANQPAPVYPTPPDLSGYATTSYVDSAVRPLATELAILSDPAPATADLEAIRREAWLNRVLTKWHAAERPTYDEVKAFVPE